MEIRIFGTVEDSIVDGPGLRYSVFVQGCPHHCPGCHNPESHDFAAGEVKEAAALIRPMDMNPLLDGLTLSGGEPMCQPEGCRLLAEAAHPARLALLQEIDVLVDGPFLLAPRSLELKYCGSKNQRLIDVKKSLVAGKVVLWEAPKW